MSTSIFQITEHVLPCQYIREYPNAVKSEQEPLKLAIKEYRPLDNLSPSPGDITILAAHGNGFPKENYEPLWDDLYHAAAIKIGSIWFADISHQGASGVLNEDLQGDDPNWFDHSRDLLHMVNHFRARMPRPIIGIAHSMGTVQLVQLSLMHPRLIHALALIEPVIQSSSPSGTNPALLTSRRPDKWPSRTQAETSFRKNPFFKTWDPRALDRHLKFGLRDVPTALYPNPVNPTEPNPHAVTLTTSKHQEAWTYLRPNFSPLSAHPQDPAEQLASPDLISLDRTYTFRRPEAALALQSLPHLRPSVLWLYGSKSLISTPASREEKSPCGTGVGGSGGVPAGQVETAVVEDATHSLPFEKVPECAALLARWLERQVERFSGQEGFYREYRSGKSERGMLALSRRWMEGVKEGTEVKRLKGKL